MKKTLLILLAGLTVGLHTAAAQSDTTVTKRTITAGHLRGVSAHSGFNVTLRQGTKSGATVSVSPELQPYLRVSVDDGILRLGFDNLPRGLQFKRLIRKADVTVTSLEELSVHSGSRITGEGPVSGASSDISVHSGANIVRLDLAMDKAGITVHSGAKATVSGTARQLEASAHSGAHADLSQLKAQDVSASAHSGARLDCAPQQVLNASAHSGGSVRYLGCGTLKSVSTDSHSGGNVRKVD